jgi:two-component system, OmpR family, sensor kinase
VIRLSIRSRLTLWYGAVVVIVLSAAGAAMIGSQNQLGLRRLDDELDRLSGAMVTVLANEIDERHDLTKAARDATGEIALRERTIAIFSADGRLLASTGTGPDARVLASLPAEARPSTFSTPEGDIRMIGTVGSHREQAYSVRVAASMAPIRIERRQFLEVLGVGLPLGLLVAAIGGWLIGRQALRPLVHMANESIAITTDGPQTRLTVPPAHDELARLGEAFNGVLGRLDAAMSAQRQFMADASHELRTPVSVIRTSAQVTIGREQRIEQEYRESLTIIAMQAERLTRMVDDMFLLARADAHARPIESTPLYLDELIAECIRGVRVIAEGRGVDVRALDSPEVPFIGDENLLRQLFVNLLENGVTHTPTGGKVVAELRHLRDTVEIIVTDSGPGVASSERDRIFERFVRLAPTGAHSGAGLGLPIARWIAERHGGRLTLESTAPEPARFVVRLPVVPNPTRT